MGFSTRMLAAAAVLGTSVSAAPPAVVQSRCARSQNLTTGTVSPSAAATPGNLLIVGIWWSGTTVQVVSVLGSGGETFSPVGNRVTASAGADSFSIALFEAVAQSPSTVVTVTLSGVPSSGGSSFLDLTLVEIRDVQAIGNIAPASGVGTVLTAGVTTVEDNELVLAYAGSVGSITSVSGLSLVVNCFGDWTATHLASDAGLVTGSFTQSSNAWATLTAGLRPTRSAGDAGMDGGQNDGGQNDGGQNDGGQNDGGQNDGGQNDGGQNDGGQNDGGQNDGGQNDGGQNDGGATDGGAPDAGPEGSADGGLDPERLGLTVGCACNEAGASVLWFAALGLLRRTNRARRLG